MASMLRSASQTVRFADPDAVLAVTLTQCAQAIAGFRVNHVQQSDLQTLLQLFNG